MNARVEALVNQARTWPPEEQAALLDALFSLVSPAQGDLESGWVMECEDRCAAIDRGEMSLIAADVVMAKYRR